jgi:hypothetical protein
VGAYDEFVSRIGKDIVEPARRKLVSSRGTIISGKMPCSMDLTGINRVGYPIGLKFEGSTKHGFVFDREGAEKIVHNVTSSAMIRLLDYQDNLYFEDKEKKEVWSGLSMNIKKMRIKLIVEKMMKDAVASFFAIGDRQQYLVLGKVDYRERGNYSYSIKEKTVPLFLFPLRGERTAIVRDLSFEVEQEGFLNFLLDESFGGEIKKIVGSDVIDMGPDIFKKLLKINNVIPSKTYSDIEDVVVDPNYTMIGSVTGLQAEYFDPVWKKII